MRNPVGEASAQEKKVARAVITVSLLGAIVFGLLRNAGFNLPLTVQTSYFASFIVLLPYIIPPFALLLMWWDFIVARIWTDGVVVAATSAVIATAYVWLVVGGASLMELLVSVFGAIAISPIATFAFYFWGKDDLVACGKCSAFLTSDMKFCYDCGHDQNRFAASASKP